MYIEPHTTEHLTFHRPHNGGTAEVSRTESPFHIEAYVFHNFELLNMH